jgi:hypothetical protein
VPASGERQRRKSRRLGKEFLLQAAALSRSCGSRAAAARLAGRREYGPAVAGDGRAASRTDGGGPRAAAPAESRTRRSRLAHSGQCQSDGRGDARWPSILDAARCDRLAGHALSLSRSRADHRRPVPGRPCAQIPSGRGLHPARAPCGTRRCRVGQARTPVFAAAASDRSWRRSPGVDVRSQVLAALPAQLGEATLEGGAERGITVRLQECVQALDFVKPRARPAMRELGQIPEQFSSHRFILRRVRCFDAFSLDCSSHYSSQ